MDLHERTHTIGQQVDQQGDGLALPEYSCKFMSLDLTEGI
jgi:hypothetical protein